MNQIYSSAIPTMDINKFKKENRLTRIVLTKAIKEKKLDMIKEKKKNLFH